MLQNLGLKGDTMGLGMCVKFGIKQDFGSGDMWGQTGSQMEPLCLFHVGCEKLVRLF